MAQGILGNEDLADVPFVKSAIKESLTSFNSDLQELSKEFEQKLFELEQNLRAELSDITNSRLTTIEANIEGLRVLCSMLNSRVSALSDRITTLEDNAADTPISTAEINSIYGGI